MMELSKDDSLVWSIEWDSETGRATNYGKQGD
jgi:hypothetical protein